MSPPVVSSVLGMVEAEVGIAQVCEPRETQELLAEFRLTGQQEPFEEIVRRYAPMVFHVCLRVTRNTHDAEDTTQAVFLTLAVQTKTGKEIRCLGPWLQQVAQRLSLDMRKSRKRRQRREERHGEMANCLRPAGDCAASLHQDELKALISEELHRLPPKYRMPLILHYFGGLSRDAMARELGCTAGALGVRLHRGREMLGQRLASRGIYLAEAALALLLADSVRQTLTESLVASTCQAATQYAMAGELGVAPLQVVGLARNAVRAALLAKVKMSALLLLAAGTVVVAGREVWARVGPLDLRLPRPSNLGDWVKPLFQIPIKPQLSDVSPPPPADVAPDVAQANQPAWEPFTGGGSRPTLSWPLASPVFGQPSALLWSSPLLESLNGLQNQRIHQGLAPGHGRQLGPVQSQQWIAQTPVTPPWRRSVLPSASSPKIGSPSLAGAPASVQPPSPRGRNNQNQRNGEKPSKLPPLEVTPLQGPNPTMHVNNTPTPAPPGFKGPVQIADAGPTIFLNQNTQRQVVVTVPTTITMPPVDPPPTQPQNPPTTGQPPVANTDPPTPEPIGPTPPSTPTKVAVANGNNTTLDSYNVTGTAFFAVRDDAIRWSNHSNSDSLTIDVRDLVSNADSGLFNRSLQLSAVTNNAESQGALLGNIVAVDPQTLKLIGPSSLTIPDTTAVHYANAANNSGPVTEFRFNTDGTAVTNTRTLAKIQGQELVSDDTTLRGWGKVGRADLFEQNGIVTADGQGKDHTLDLRGVKQIRNTQDNPVPGGTNGWFAVSHGKLTLPRIKVAAGTGTYTWGESDDDAELDLINSVRLTLHDVKQPGALEMSLLALDHGQIPSLPQGHKFIGVWSLSSLDFDSVDLTVRYDDLRVVALNLNEDALKLWGYDGSQWNRILDSVTLDKVDNIIQGRVGNITWFAVSTPEPGSLLLLGGAAGWLLMRRRRR